MEELLPRLFAQYDVDKSGALDEAAMRRVLRDMGLQPETDAHDAAAETELLSRLRGSGEV